MDISLRKFKVKVERISSVEAIFINISVNNLKVIFLLKLLKMDPIFMKRVQLLRWITTLPSRDSSLLCDFVISSKVIENSIIDCYITA